MSNIGGKREGAGRKAGVPNRSTAYMRGLAGKHASEAIATLVDIMTDPESPAAARVSASKEIIERGFGKSGNIVSLNLETPLAELQPKDALAVVSDKVIKGELPVDDGTKLTSMIEARMRAVEVAELECRLKALETQ